MSVLTNDGQRGVANVSTTQLTSNVVTITTTAAHGFLKDEQVTIAGCQGPLGVQGAALNGTFVIASIPADPSGVQFTYASTHADLIQAGEPAGAQGTMQGYVTPIAAGTTEIQLTTPNGANKLWVYGETQAVKVRRTSGSDVGSFVVPSATWKSIDMQPGQVVYIGRGSSTALDFYFGTLGSN